MRNTILIVDDSLFNRQMLCDILKGKYELIEASDGQEAMDIIEKQREKIAAILLDVVMPNMDGVTLLKLLNEKKYMRVEVQFRTIAMDFWASLEHKVKYKKEIAKKSDAEISKELKICADEIAKLDLRMQDIRKKINFYKDFT